MHRHRMPASALTTSPARWSASETTTTSAGSQRMASSSRKGPHISVSTARTRTRSRWSRVIRRQSCSAGNLCRLEKADQRSHRWWDRCECEGMLLVNANNKDRGDQFAFVCVVPVAVLHFSCARREVHSLKGHGCCGCHCQGSKEERIAARRLFTAGEARAMGPTSWSPIAICIFHVCIIPFVYSSFVQSFIPLVCLHVSM